MFSFLKQYFEAAEFSIFLAVLVSSLLVINFINIIKRKKQYKLPPGPIGIPFFGYLPFLGSKPHKTFYKLTKKYGNVISCYLGRTLVVVLNDWKAVEDAYNQPETLDRPLGFDSYLPFGVGFVGQNGQRWRDERRFVVKSMRNIGLGRPEWENVIKEEVNEIVEEIKSHNGQVIDMTDVVATTFTNNILTLIRGKKLPRTHPDLISISKILDFVNKRFFALSSYIFTPTLYLLLVKLGLYDNTEAFKKTEKFCEFIKHYIEETLKTTSKNDGNFAQIFQAKIDSDSLLAKRDLYGNTAGLIFGGADSTTATTLWFLVAMAKHQNVQARIQQELDSVLGKDGTITWAEKERVPYTYATIMELLRWKSIVPITSLRQINKDIKVQGYDLPKGTILTINQWALHNDPRYWPEPRKFNPERFLLNDGKDINNSLESYVPFSHGKRRCPGGNIALMELFEYFVALMKNFRVLPPEEGLKYKSEIGITFIPKGVKLRFESRDATGV